MLKFVVIFGLYGVVFVASVVNPGPKYPPTKGEVWPAPQKQTKDSTFYTFNSAKFKVEIKGETCSLLQNAIDRYSYIIKRNTRQTRRPRSSKRRRHHDPEHCDRLEHDDNYRGRLRKLRVSLNQPCEDYPYFEMDEKYSLTVNSTTSVIESESVWGVLRGLETFVQLFYTSDNGNDVIINSTVISDYPRYAHRGLLLDTARHFVSLPNILTLLDAMAINKMNVFHWHIVDDQSFPYQSERFPELSREGAYHPSLVYSKCDIEDVVQYARDRGIRVIPEFDVPGHTRSWGVAYPKILTECYEDGRVVGLGPMNPVNNLTYKLVGELFQEVQQWFPDKYFHVGGDEVELSCWKSNPELQEYMKQHNMSASGLHALFMRRAIPLLAPGTSPLVWQEVFDEGVELSPNTLVHVWKWEWINELIKVLNAGHRVLFSSEWYLDHLDYEFDKLYTADPAQAVAGRLRNDSLVLNLQGGEACMWGEMTDDRNLLSRIWPRASAVAERLWSAPLSAAYNDMPGALERAKHRLEEHTCRMIRRGIPAQPPLGPGFCIT